MRAFESPLQFVASSLPSIRDPRLAPRRLFSAATAALGIVDTVLGDRIVAKCKFVKLVLLTASLLTHPLVCSGGSKSFSPGNLPEWICGNSYRLLEIRY